MPKKVRKKPPPSVRTPEHVGRTSGPTASLLGAWYDRTSNSVLNYPLLLLIATCQLATIVISWPVWNVRTTPPLLPLVTLPEVSFGIPLVISLLVVIPWPRIGVAVHTALLLLAIIADQHRLQPQIISLAVLMIGCLQPTAAYLTRWYLIAMWLWAGLHKFLSPEWYGFQAWWFLQECGLDGDTWHLPFAIAVAAFETALGVLAIVRPKWAVWPAVALHVGLLILLSPLVRNFNASVWPWNIATAVAAYWLLNLKAEVATTDVRAAWLKRGVIATLFIGPALYYVDLVNPHLAFVLYSGNMPRAIHRRQDSYSRIDGWTGLTVPFPDSAYLLIAKFRLTAKPGERLHISEPRPGIDDRYFVLNDDGELLELSRDEFWQDNPRDQPAVPPLELEDAQLVWRLQQAGFDLAPYGSAGPVKSVVSVRSPARDVHRIDPVLIGGLPNLLELRLDDLTLDERAVHAISNLPRLEILELTNCRLPRAGFAIFCNRPQLQTLNLSRTNVADEDLALVYPGCQLSWLDLTGTRITSVGLRKLPVLANCNWLTLTDTPIDDDGLVSLPDWPKLEVLILTRTKITDRAVPTLCRLPKCQHLNVSGTAISPVGNAQLRAAMPAAMIED